MTDQRISYEDLYGIEGMYIYDCNAPQFMFPVQFRSSDNSLYIECLKRELRIAIMRDLTEEQRFCIREFYGHGRKRVDIAREMGIGGSTVSKYMNAAETKLRNHLEPFSDMYKRIERSVCSLYC